MKNIGYFFSIVIVFALFASCKKDDPHTINIDYPAAYVVNGQSNDISVIRLSDNTVTETIPLNGSFPHHIYLSPDKTKLAVAITGIDLSNGQVGEGGAGYKILILNAVTGAVEKEISLPKLAHNAAFSRDGTELWLGQSDSLESTVLVFRTSDWQATDTIFVGSYVSEVNFTSDGSMAMAACHGWSDWVNMIEIDTKDVECATYTMGDNPIGMWPGTSAYGYANNETFQSISEIDIENDSTKSVIQLNFRPGCTAYKSSNDELWVSDATNGRVVVFINNGSAWVQQFVITTGANTHAIAFNSDESIAYATNEGNGTVSVINTNTHAKITDIPVGQKPNGIAIRE